MEEPSPMDFFIILGWRYLTAFIRQNTSEKLP